MPSILRPLTFGTAIQRRSAGIVFVILGLLGVTYIAEKVVLSYCERNWESLADAWSVQQLEAVKNEVVLVQRNARRIAAELGRHEAVVSYLRGASGNLAAVFDRAARVAELHDVGVEVYDRQGRLIAWHGRSGAVDAVEIQKALRGELTSYVSRGPIYSHLFVITPVRIEGSYYGAILVRKAIEVNYPLSNAFIKPAGLSEKFTRELGVNVELTYGDEAEPRRDGSHVSSVIYGIDGRKLGVASILRLSRSAYLEQIAGMFEKVYAALAFLLLVFTALLFVTWWRKQDSLLVRCILITAAIWVGRYVLLWLEVPSVFIELSVFDPVYFASKFGWGLAKSIGEMTLTACALFLNVAIIVRLALTRMAGSTLWRPRHMVARLALAGAATVFIFFALRGVAAVVRSAVFDSSLRFNDPIVVIPSFELAMMVLNILLTSFSLCVVAVALTGYLVWMFGGTENDQRWRLTALGIVLFLYLLAGVVFDVIQESPLVSVPFRIGFGVALLAVTILLWRKYRRGVPPISFGNALMMLALSALFFYPVLDEAVHEQDRERIQAFAQELLRPTDVWLKYVVDESLHQFLTDEVLETLMYGTRDEQERVAFTCWARSVAARQGYNCSFWLLDARGNELSAFAIGAASYEMALSRPSLDELNRDTVIVHQRGTGFGAVKMYQGSIPIFAADSCLGYGVVMISAQQQSLFRGETPTVFRTSSQENIETFYRSISLVEFRGDSLVAATGDLPLDYHLPQEVVEAFFGNPARVSVWIDEIINEKEYESYFVRSSADSPQIIGLQTERLGARWHLFGLVKMLVYYAIVLLAVGAIVFILRWFMDKPYRFSFRDRLLIGFLMTALVPVVIIAMYVRELAAERVQEYLAGHLWNETAQVEHVLQRQQDPVLMERVKSDFNYYTQNRLVLSTRPELYNSGILDRRLSGSAYAAIMVRGKRFYMEMENIGLYRYAVGYRPVLDTRGTVEGIVAVPALYRQDDIDRDVARTNALLFGVYAIVVILVSLVATTLANRIASPIQKLTRATKQVAAGDLDVKIHARADGEIGELIQSFEAMTRELKSSRQNLIQYERELAWKEMAKQVAHEIKNPLTPMKLALQHLQQTYRDKVENFSEVFEEVSQMVIRQVDALSRIASEFSHFARMPKAHLEPCDVNEILSDAIRLFEHEQIEIERNLERPLPPVYADREELRRAFINIIRNGIQAMGGKGKIIVSSARKGPDVEVRIRDFGTGIPEEIRHKLFQPNFSTKTDGMGLGLAIVKKTIDDLNGAIEIDSEVNKGTTVILRIPRIETASHESSANSVR